MTFSNALFDQSLAYSAQDLRQLEENIINGVGVSEPSALVVSAGTGFNSNIAAGRGSVRNSVQTQGGLYVVRNNAAVAALHNTPDATNPRIDQVFVKVSDNIDGGDASDTVNPIIIAGTPTAGATLANRNGVGSTPTNSVILADVLVPNGAGSAAAFTYADRRPVSLPGLLTAATGQGVLNESVLPIPIGNQTIGNDGLGIAQLFPGAGLIYIPRRVNAANLRWGYKQGGTANAAQYSWTLFDASGALVGASVGFNWTGAINAIVRKTDAVNWGFLDAGNYYLCWYPATFTASSQISTSHWNWSGTPVPGISYGGNATTAASMVLTSKRLIDVAAGTGAPVALVDCSTWGTGAPTTTIPVCTLGV